MLQLFCSDKFIFQRIYDRQSPLRLKEITKPVEGNKKKEVNFDRSRECRYE